MLLSEFGIYAVHNFISEEFSFLSKDFTLVFRPFQFMKDWVGPADMDLQFKQ